MAKEIKFEDSKNDVCIVSYARTPCGALGGALSAFTAPQLGAIAIEAAVRRATIDFTDVGEVFMGHVLTAGVGQAPAKQAALAAGLPTGTPCTSVNKVCASGLKACMLGASALRLGDRDCVVVGGMESMSNAPYLCKATRRGSRMGDVVLKDSVICDGLTDTCGSELLGEVMGMAAERCAAKHGISRAQQDEDAFLSYQRALGAHEGGQFRDEIVEVRVTRPKDSDTLIAIDEEVSRRAARTTLSSLAAMRPAFSKAPSASVTAGNSSTISDGAAALVLCRREWAQQKGIAVLGVLRGYADAAKASEEFPTAPALAIPLALKAAHPHLTAQNVHWFEINEAFSVVSLANKAILEVGRERVNVFGGSVAIGHPIGASGARLLCTLLSIFRHKGGRLGCVGICNGGGGASAVVVESLMSRADSHCPVDAERSRL